MNPTKKKLFLLIALSVILGVYIPFYFVFVNAEFLRTIAPKYLPFAYVFGGIGGYFFARFFNTIEKRYSTKKTLTGFSFLIALIIGLLWLFYVLADDKVVIVFLSYAWFWISSSTAILIFWKIPTLIFNLSENKKYNSLISLGEVIAAIFVYILIIPFFNTLEFIRRDYFLIISAVSLFVFSFIISLLQINEVQPEKKNEVKSAVKVNFFELLKNDLFKYLFYSIVLTMVIQLFVDFSLMNITKAKSAQLGFEVASFFSIVFGCMRILELIFKLFVSKNVIQDYGIFGGFYSLIFTIGFIYVIGLITHLVSDNSGLVIIILAIAAIGKVMERSINRSLFIPSQNILYQAFDGGLKSLVQSYSSGFGVPIGQFLAGLLMVVFLWIDSYETKITLLFIFLILVSLVWFFNTSKLKKGYEKQLQLMGAALSKHLKQSDDEDIEKAPMPDQQATFEATTQLDTIIQSSLLEYQKKKDKHIITKGIVQFNHVINKTSKDDLVPLIEGSNNGLFLRFTEVILDLKMDCSFYNQLILLFCKPGMPAYLDQVYAGSEYAALEKLIASASILNIDLNYKLHHLYMVLLRLKVLYYNKLLLLKKEAFLEQIKKESQEYYLDILTRLSFSNVKEEQKLIFIFKDLFSNGINEYCMVTNLINNLKIDPEFKSLTNLLFLESEYKMKVVFVLLGIKYNSDFVSNIRKLIFEGTSEMRMIGIEMLENNLDQDDLRILSPILRYDDPATLLKKVESEFPQPIYDIKQTLTAILFYYKNRLSILTVNLALKFIKSLDVELNEDKIVSLCYTNDPILSTSARALLPTSKESVKEKMSISTRVDYFSSIATNIETIVSGFIALKYPIQKFKILTMNLNANFEVNEGLKEWVD